MNYKGFEGYAQWDDEAKAYTGNVTNTRAVITFQGDDEHSAEKEFHASVDDYLDWCKADKVEPETPESALAIAL